MAIGSAYGRHVWSLALAIGLVGLPVAVAGVGVLGFLDGAAGAALGVVVAPVTVFGALLALSLPVVPALIWGSDRSARTRIAITVLCGVYPVAVREAGVVLARAFDRAVAQSLATFADRGSVFLAAVAMIAVAGLFFAIHSVLKFENR